MKECESMKIFKKLPTIDTWIEELRRTEMDPRLRGELIEKSINMYIDRELEIGRRFCAIAVVISSLEILWTVSRCIMK